MRRVNFASFKSLMTLFSVVFLNCAYGSLAEQREGLETIYNEVQYFFPQETIEYVKNRVCDSKIQEAMKGLLSSESAVKRPDCLDIPKIATLMELTLKFKYEGQTADQLEFLKLAKNHRNNTPPYFMNLPENMPAEARDVIFQRLRKQIDQDVQSKMGWQKARAAALSRGLNPSEVDLNTVCLNNYKYLYAVLFGRLVTLKRGMGWLNVMAQNMEEQNTINNFIAPGPDVSKFTAANALEYKSIPCLQEAAKSGLGNLAPRIQEIKNIYPLIVFLDKYTGSQHAILPSLHKILFQMEMAYASNHEYLRATVDNYTYFLELRESGQFDKNYSETLQKLEERYNQNNTQYLDFCQAQEQLVIQEYAAIDKEVDDYYNALQLAQKEAQRMEREKRQQQKQASNQKQKERARQQMAEAAKLSQELRKAEEERAASKEAAAQGSTQTAPTKRVKKEYATNEGAFTAWYWESLKEFSLKKEARLEAQKRLEAEANLAQSKTLKKHDVDPAKVSSSASTSSNASSSSSAVSEEGKNKVEPAKIILGSNHYDQYEVFMTNKNCEYNKEQLTNVVTALGGHVVPRKAGGVTVAGYVRHIDTGEVINFSIHYHPKNGIDTLRPVQVLDIQKMLIQAGYTQDRVIRKIGADYENTVPKSSAQTTHTTSATTSSSSASSAASNSSTSQTPTPLSNNNNDDGE